MNKVSFAVINEKERRFPYSLFGIGMEVNQKHLDRPEGFPALLWIQTVRGSGKIIIGGEEYSFKAGQGMWILPGVAHEIYPDEEDWIIDWLALNDQESITFLTETIKVRPAKVYQITDPEAMQDLMERIAKLEGSNDALKEYTQSINIYGLLIAFARYQVVSSRNSLDLYFSRLQPVFQYINDNYHQSFTLQDLADLLQITPQHLCTLFRKVMKTRIFEYVNLVRIQKSKEELIASPLLSIREIAHNNGFEDVSYYCYIFKRHEKMTPGDFRKMML